MRLRLRHALALGMTATAPALAVLAAPAAADDTAGFTTAWTYADTAPPCGSDGAGGFPVESRIHGGPAAYIPGGPPEPWSIDLTNTSDGVCGNVHPVLVLLDRARRLEPEQVRLEFHDVSAGAWRPVRVEETDEDEYVGVLDAGFRGLTLEPGETGTVEVRLAFAEGTAADRMAVRAALVQRRGGDGEWVGESADYSFTVERRADGPADGPAEPEAETGTGTGPGESGDTGAGTRGETGTEVPPRNGRERGDGTGAGFAELAATGRGAALIGPGVAAGVLLLGGWALTAAARRLGARRR